MKSLSQSHTARTCGAGMRPRALRLQKTHSHPTLSCCLSAKGCPSSKQKPDSGSKKFSLHFCRTNGSARTPAARLSERPADHTAVVQWTFPSVVPAGERGAPSDLLPHPRQQIPPSIPPVSCLRDRTHGPQKGRATLWNRQAIHDLHTLAISNTRPPSAGDSQSRGFGGLEHA